MNLSPLQKLDKVLEILNENSKITIANIVSRAKRQLIAEESILILNKLIKDEYVEKFQANEYVSPYTEVTYWITFEGRVFIEQGGYVLQAAIVVQNENRRVSYDRKLLQGTWFAGIVGLLVLLYYIFAYFYPPSSASGVKTIYRFYYIKNSQSIR